MFQPTLAELEQHIDERTKILYLVNPNNPTGNVYLPAEVLDLALRYPHVLVISDEAYFEFSGVSCVKLVDEVPNLASLDLNPVIVSGSGAVVLGSAARIRMHWERIDIGVRRLLDA